jgi:hypothetical protein
MRRIEIALIPILLVILLICIGIKSIPQSQAQGQQGVRLEVTMQYVQDDEVYCDFILDGEKYEGVTYDDMFDMLNDACLNDIESTL